MSTSLRDVPSNALIGQSITPRVATASLNGATLDAISADGRCTAIQQTGTIGGSSPSLAGKIQESADNSTWADISGATFTAVTANDSTQSIAFDRTKRYLRYVGTIAGTSPTIPLAVIILEQKKQI